MNAKKHKFSVQYLPMRREWLIFDNGVLHSGGYKSHDEALEQIKQLTGGEQMTQKHLLHFIKDWKNRIRNLQ